MSTLLSLCQDAADMIGAQRPSVVIGSTDSTAKRLLGLIKLECRMLMKRHTWSVLAREHSFATVNGTASYALPSDWDRYVTNTAWDQDNYWQLRGALTPAQWQFRRNATLARPANRRLFRVKFDTSTKVNAIFIEPTPTAAADLIIEYVSTQFCKSAAAAMQSAWTADTDVPMLDETLLILGLRWRYLNARGLPYLEEQKEYRKSVVRAIGDDGGTVGTIDLSGGAGYSTGLPEGNFTL